MRIIRLFNSLEGNSFESKVKNTLLAIIKESNGKSIVKLNIYLNSDSSENYKDEYITTSNIIKDVFKKNTPAFNIISHNTDKESNFTIECVFIDSNLQIKYKSILNHPYVSITHKNGTEIISGGIQFDEESLLFNMQRCFDCAEQILMAEDLNFGHIIIQNNYIPKIEKVSKYDASYISNIEIFNEIKNFFYEEPLFKNGKPLEIILGNYFGNFSMDFTAFSELTDNVKSISIDDKIVNGKLLKTENNEIWLSNPISEKIRISKTSNDIEQQTFETLKGLLKVIKSNYLEKTDGFISNQNHAKDLFQLIKIYVKHHSDNKKVKEIISETIPNTKILLLNTDLSVNKLLVDIVGYLKIDRNS